MRDEQVIGVLDGLLERERLRPGQTVFLDICYAIGGGAGSVASAVGEGDRVDYAGHGWSDVDVPAGSSGWFADVRLVVLPRRGASASGNLPPDGTLTTISPNGAGQPPSIRSEPSPGLPAGFDVKVLTSGDIDLRHLPRSSGGDLMVGTRVTADLVNMATVTFDQFQPSEVDEITEVTVPSSTWTEGRATLLVPKGFVGVSLRGAHESVFTRPIGVPDELDDELPLGDVKPFVVTADVFEGGVLAYVAEGLGGAHHEVWDAQFLAGYLKARGLTVDQPVLLLVHEAGRDLDEAGPFGLKLAQALRGLGGRNRVIAPVGSVLPDHESGELRVILRLVDDSNVPKWRTFGDDVMAGRVQEGVSPPRLIDRRQEDRQWAALTRVDLTEIEEHDIEPVWQGDDGLPLFRLDTRGYRTRPRDFPDQPVPAPAGIPGRRHMEWDARIHDPQSEAVLQAALQSED